MLAFQPGDKVLVTTLIKGELISINPQLQNEIFYRDERHKCRVPFLKPVKE